MIEIRAGLHEKASPFLLQMVVCRVTASQLTGKQEGRGITPCPSPPKAPRFLLMGMLVGGHGVLVGLLAVLVGGGGVLLGFLVVALVVLVGRLVVVVLGGGVVSGRVQVVLGGGMLGGCHGG